MAVTHLQATAGNAATDAVTALIGGTGNLVFRITGSTAASPATAVATLPLSATAFGAASAGIATAGAITSDTNAAGGTVAFATIQSGAAAIVIHCAVAASGSDIDFSNGLVVTAGDTVECSALTYQALSA